eukprot:CAMPEP_0177454314 /NCGR_PEP_ID=MMETSP0369-20130122/11308_1 /TAXON_ID=447022 ORGANISM="Scrippsiella hangoei-like, Strain SHHI-4" /NCGR_SAMPLE_ID=MMETSP0369 /ASSEMBLY_ACC=CAM_ASM_000364 /LENGTH=457 /DNA_ID=CAMNT_0018927111 /DNA_START=44 /DNA_END=1414 /DNA_ORIENTATION=-
MAVMGTPSQNEHALIAANALHLHPFGSFANAELIEHVFGFSIVKGWAIFERLDEPVGSAFVAVRFWWNALADGTWIDFTPRPDHLPVVLLAEAATHYPKVKSKLSNLEADLAAYMAQKMFGDPDSVVPVSMSHHRVPAPKQELVRANREANEACAEMRCLEAQVASLRHRLFSLVPDASNRWDPGRPIDGIDLGSMVRVCGLSDCPDLNGQDVIIVGFDTQRSKWRARLCTGEIRVFSGVNLEVLDAAKINPELSTFGCEILCSIPCGKRRIHCNLWPLVHSGIIRSRVPDRLLAKLNILFDALHDDHNSPSHGLFLVGEVKDGKQLTVRHPDEEYVALLLACAEQLGHSIFGSDSSMMHYNLDQVWTVHQHSGDYNPMHFHTNARSEFGFSSFLHVKLPPQLQTSQQMKRDAMGQEQRDGVTSFMWRTDTGIVAERLECSGVLDCELAEGFLYVFP